MACYASPHVHLSNKMDRNLLILNPGTCITLLLHPRNQMPVLHQQESSQLSHPTPPLLHPHAQMPKHPLSTLHHPTLLHLESQIAVVASVLIHSLPALPEVKMMIWCLLAPFLARYMYIDILMYKQIPCIVELHFTCTLYLQVITIYDDSTGYIQTTTLVFQLKTANLLVIARYMCSTLLATHSDKN